MKPRLLLAVCAILLGSGLAVGTGLAEEAKKKPVRPPTKQTQTLRAETFKKMEAIQKAFDDKQYAEAIRGLDEIRSRVDKLNDFERGTMWNYYAVVRYAQNDVKGAIDAYKEVLKQPNLPEGLRNNSLYALAQMYFISEDYKRAIVVLNSYLKTVAQPSPDAHVLIAQAHYQVGAFKAAEESLLTALRIARDNQQQPKENWLALLRAVYYENKAYEKSAKVLEVLAANYVKDTYWLQLSGMYGLNGKQKAQLASLHAAYRNGMVTREADLLNLARLYMVEEAPYAAVRVLARGFKARQINISTETLQLYAQALSLSKEYESQVPVLKKLAELSGEGKHYVFLGQAQSELGQWKEAVDSYRRALREGGLSDVDSVRMQLGTALFNSGQLDEARRVFLAATSSEKVGTSAANWAKFVTVEIQKRDALRGVAREPLHGEGVEPESGDEEADEAPAATEADAARGGEVMQG